MTFTSCNKPHLSNAGQWRWEYSSGGFTGRTILTSSESKVTLTLKADLTFIIYKNDCIQDTGSYTISIDSNSTSFIHFSKSIYLNDYVVMSKEFIRKSDSGNLILDDGCCDRYLHYFKLNK